jgi:hypothetical protein
MDIAFHIKANEVEYILVPVHLGFLSIGLVCKSQSARAWAGSSLLARPLAREGDLQAGEDFKVTLICAIGFVLGYIQLCAIWRHFMTERVFLSASD